MKMNPYERIKEIEELLAPLEAQEKQFKNTVWKRKPQALEKIEHEIFFLVIEMNHIKQTINWFEKERSDIRKERERILKAILIEIQYQQGLNNRWGHKKTMEVVAIRIKDIKKKIKEIINQEDEVKIT